MSKLIEAIRTKAEWKKVNWEALPSTYRDISHTWCVDYRYMVGKSHILQYVEYLMKEGARAFDCDFENFEKLIKDENTAFFTALNKLFIYKDQQIGKNHQDLKIVLDLFRMPSAKGFSHTETDTNVFSEVTTEQISAIFTTIIEQMVPEEKQTEFKKKFNI